MLPLRLLLLEFMGLNIASPLTTPVLNEHGIFYPKALTESLMFEITLTSVADLVVYENADIAPNYSLSHLELEYSCISSDVLASRASSAYQIGKGLQYENIILHKTFTIANKVDEVINQHINLPRKSMTGILCLFTETYTGGTRDSEKFINPSLTSVQINIDGLPNRLYSKGMVPTDFWKAFEKTM